MKTRVRPGFLYGLGAALLLLGAGAYARALASEPQGASLVLRALWALGAYHRVAPDPDLPTMELHLSEEDRAHFRDIYAAFERDEAGVREYQERNRWRDSFLTWNGKRYAMRIKSQGRTPYMHHDHRDISYTIKLRNREQIAHAKRFNLIIFPRVRRHADALRLLARELNVVADRAFPVRLRFDDGYEALYFFEYRGNGAYLDDIGWPTLLSLGSRGYDSPVISVRARDAGTLDALPDLMAAVAEDLEDSSLPEGHRRSVLDRVRELNEDLVTEDPGFDELFDVAYVGRFLAISLLTGPCGHGLGGNNRVYFDGATGQFYPAFHRDHFPRAIGQDPATLWRLAYHADEIAWPFWERVVRSDALRAAAWQAVYDVAKDGAVLDRVERELEAIRLRDRHYLPEFPHVLWLLEQTAGMARTRPEARDIGDPMRGNAARLKAIAERVAPRVRAGTHDGWTVLAVETDAHVPLAVDRLRVRAPDGPRAYTARATEVGDGARTLTTVTATREQAGDTVDLAGAFDGLALWGHLDATLRHVARTYYLAVRAGDGGGDGAAELVELSVRNTVTGEVHRIDDVQPLAPDAVPEGFLADLPPAPTPAQALATEHPELRWRDGEGRRVHLSAGTYTVEHDVRVPTGVALVIDAGVRLSLAAGVSILARGGLEVAGTREAPVVIEAASSTAPFGSLAAIGDGRSGCRLSHLTVRGGSETFLEGAHLSGAVSLYRHGRVELDHVRIEGSRADDGLNVKYAEIRITDSAFANNRADQVDLDVVSGIVTRSRFHASGGAELDADNGDGLDVSFSDVLVFDDDFSGFGDKAVSVGEKSRVGLADNRFEHSRVGVAVKGSSRALLWSDNRFEGNDMDVAAFKKQRIFEGGEVYLVRREGLSAHQDDQSHTWVVEAPAWRPPSEAAEARATLDAAFARADGSKAPAADVARLVYDVQTRHAIAR